MRKVKVSELRQYLPSFLKRVRQGEEYQITLHGKVIARLTPELEDSDRVKASLAELRKTAQLGDVISPLGESWDAEHGGV